MNRKEQILELRQQGKSYSEIVKLTGYSKSLVCYYCGTNQKEKSSNRQIKNRAISHPFKRKIDCFIYYKPKIRSKKYKYSNKDSVLIYHKIIKFCSKEGESVTKNFTIEDVIEKFGPNPKCYLTGQDIDINKPRTYEFDHIIPRSRGGENTLENLGICTKDANRAKRAMTSDEFINFCKLVVKNQGYTLTKMG